LQESLRVVRRSVRRAALRALSRFGPAGDGPPPDLRARRSVLFVLVNFRLGNTLIAASAAEAVARALPGCRVGFLGGPVGPTLLAASPVAVVHVFARGDRWRPWRALALVRALRRERWEVAVHLGSSASALGALLAGVSGAPDRVGWEGRGGNLFYTSVLPPPKARHKLAALDELLRALGLDVDVHRRVSLRADELSRAAARLAERFGAAAGAPVAIFTGGRARKGKAWTLEGLGALAGRLRERGVPVVGVLGPEERARWPEIRAALGDALLLESPPLRELAAVCARCRAVVVPDSGPMHLAIASGAPVVALFRRGNHVRWGPRPPGESVVDPEGREVEAVLAALERAARPATALE
jgi:ADP-heptose:LPS heptosyltransferase